MTLSQSIQREKQSLQLGGAYNNFNSNLQKGFDLLSNSAFSYGNGLKIGQGLGYNEDSQKDLGMIGLINSTLNSTASLIQDGRRDRESEQRALERRLNGYMRIPRDRYAYDPYTENNYTQDYYQKGGERSYTVPYNGERYTYLGGKLYHKGKTLDPNSLGQEFIDASKKILPNGFFGNTQNTLSRNEIANNLLNNLPLANSPQGFPSNSNIPTNRNQQIQNARDSLAIGRLPKEYVDRYTPGVSEQFVDMMPSSYNFDYVGENFNTPVISEVGEGSHRWQLNMLSGLNPDPYKMEARRLKTIGVSDYRPSQGAEKDYYFNSKNLNKKEFLEGTLKSLPKYGNKLVGYDDDFFLKDGDPNLNLELGTYTIGHGMDETKGKPYVSYYDDWNLDPQKSWGIMIPKMGVKLLMKQQGIPIPNNFDKLYEKYKGGEGLAEILGLGKGIPIYDRVYYDPNNNNQVVEYARGGTHGARTTTFNRSGYKAGTKDFLNRYDSYNPIRNNHVGPSNDGFTSVFGKDGLDFTHVTNTNGRTFAPKERHINLTGYTEGTPSNNNDYNIIPGSHITSKGMDKDTVLDVYPINENNEIGKRFPFAYKQGSPDIINPYQGIKGFLEVKRK